MPLKSSLRRILTVASVTSALLPFAAISQSTLRIPLPNTPVRSLMESAPGREDSDRKSSHPGAEKLEVVRCSSIPKAIRAMVFEHFQLIRDQKAAAGKPLDEDDAHDFARALGRIPKESSGDPTCMTRMDSSQIGTYEAASDLEHWNALFENGYKMGTATNFGLLQVSTNRLTVGFVGREPSDVLDALGDSLNPFVVMTEEQTRRIFLGYVRFAQNELMTRNSVRDTLRLCGTPFLYREGQQGEKGLAALEKAMKSIINEIPFEVEVDPKTRKQRRKWATRHAHVQAFGKWVTLCPNLGFDIGMIQPPEYFATETRNVIACEETFKALLK